MNKYVIIGAITLLGLLIFRVEIMSFLDSKSNKKIITNVQKNIELDKNNVLLEEKKKQIKENINQNQINKNNNIKRVQSFSRQETERYWLDELGD